ncbi:MAG: MOSC domain-containing protein [Mailhella sp.]|nr:MOSC domain-containing protein [Mailhella sp.]
MRIAAVSTSARKGEKKVNRSEITLVANHGVQGDAHADGTHRQLSLLALEDVEYMRSMGADVHPGDFAENITTEGVVLHTLPVGTHFGIGKDIELVLTQIGKECHMGCAIRQQVGDCIMPRRGVFCRILKGGVVRPGDEFRVLSVPEVLPVQEG